jgi:hypothetical protein
MITNNSEERVAFNKLMDRFCANQKVELEYEPIYDFDHIDARLYWKTGKHKNKVCGHVKMFKMREKYGSKPSALIKAAPLEILYQLSLLCGVSAAVIAKFRDKAKYFKVEDTAKYKLQDNKLVIPIGDLKDL